jgi:hypothetical protein
MNERGPRPGPASPQDWGLLRLVAVLADIAGGCHADQQDEMTAGEVRSPAVVEEIDGVVANPAASRSHVPAGKSTDA